MIWFKQKEKEKVAKRPTRDESTLTIFLRSLPRGSSIGWSVPYDGPAPSAPWVHFYKWYFDRPQSDHILMHYKGGETLVLRADIIRFEVRIVEKYYTPVEEILGE